MDYLATQEPAVLTYRKSNMVLAIHSNASYLNELKAQSRAGGHHFLSENVPLPPNNGAIHNVAEIIKGVMSSAAKADVGAMYINAHKAVEERIILEELGHKQPTTPIQVDNSTTKGIINKWVQPKHTKAMDMRFHWLRDHSINQQQFRFYWCPAPQTMPTTGRNIIRQCTIATWDRYSSHLSVSSLSFVKRWIIWPQEVIKTFHTISYASRLSTARVC